MLRGATLLTLLRQAGRKTKAESGADDDDDDAVTQPRDETGTHEVTLPGKPGKYELVATLCAPRITLARAGITATPAQITIEAPERAPMGSVLRAVVSGTLNRGHVRLQRDVQHDAAGRPRVRPLAPGELQRRCRNGPMAQ